MDTTILGRGGPRVSRFALGTMTWGSQNTAGEAFQQLDFALDRGITLVDTAEAYPTTPTRAETMGRTETIIGDWLARGGRRGDVVLATKVAGAGQRLIRDGAPISPATLRTALEGSLRRLRTDHVELYQLHWPNRGSYHFRQSWTYDPTGQRQGEPERMLEILETLAGFVAEGKVRHVGLSNETAWGTAAFLRLAEENGLPRVVSIQNEYSLLHRLFDLDLAELCHHEEVGLLAYSPLASGLLSGKYADGARPAGSRATINPDLNGRLNPRSEPAAAAYAGLAREHGHDPAQMALAFAATRPFVASVILGATSMAQLEIDVAAAELALPPEALAGIAAIHRAHPIPM